MQSGAHFELRVTVAPVLQALPGLRLNLPRKHESACVRKTAC
jgi:hypothetical protein